jgi:hypothetical protein
MIKVKYKDITTNLPLVITLTGNTPMFGRNWLPGVSNIKPLKRDVSASQSKDNSLEDVLQRNSKLFALLYWRSG